MIGAASMVRSVYIDDVSIVCPLGDSAPQVRQNALSKNPSKISANFTLHDGRAVPIGIVSIPHEDNLQSEETRCNRIAELCLSKLEATIAHKSEQIPAERIGVVIGTCTSGVQEGSLAMRSRLADGIWPPGFRFSAQELGDTARYVAKQIGARGPTYGVSTACTSGAKAMVCGARLIQADLCDLVIAGGIDALSDLTVYGFAALESLSDEVCNPFSINRRGINLGEGGAIFVLSGHQSPIRLSGWGESADAHHISAPDPEGRGAQAAMEMALRRASIGASEIGYVNLHGTATRLNDSMEAIAVARVLGLDVPCSSTKPMTGHMLGAAGACEAAFAMFALETSSLPVHIWDGERDTALPPIRFADVGDEPHQFRYAMSCSYAFGGNNVVIILERQ